MANSPYAPLLSIPTVGMKPMKTAIILGMMLVTATLGLLAADSATAGPILPCSDTPDPRDGSTGTTCDTGNCFVTYDPFRPSGVGCRSPCVAVGLHGGEYWCL